CARWSGPDFDSW
nr:immunoglobulin heavy chain junction region [Macaca mulatta]MOV50608.1 immunoglobulin heavy chain junction region [Macaca mulatta]